MGISFLGLRMDYFMTLLQQGHYFVDIDIQVAGLHQQRIRALIWRFYQDLRTYRAEPTARRRGELRARFDRIFRRRTGFVTLDRLLARLHANKPELLMVLDRPEIPLHTNGSERDIRLHVTKRKISGGTRNDAGRRCRDTFASLKKTCRKLGLRFWDYLQDRVRGLGKIARLAELMRQKARQTTAAVGQAVPAN